ncbi:hypothetical protein CASFOL_003845 [Castilleja foliolosa]|uniref:Galectin domain-containing protein n=1 Tax=Castilleja foliolosa TaxID=1961234 RepID=A0ABD3EIU2_9LAMI
MGFSKRAKIDSLVSLSRLRSIQVLSGLLFLYLIFITFEIPMVLKAGLGLESPEAESNLPLTSHPNFGAQNDNQLLANKRERHASRTQERKMGDEFKKISGLIFDENAFNSVSRDEFSELHKVVRDAFVSGKKVLGDFKSGKVTMAAMSEVENMTPKKADEPCPSSVVLRGDEFVKKGKMMVIPCGLSLGSHITVVGRPRWAHVDNSSRIALAKNEMVSQFMMELQGLSAVDGEDPPRILHYNPRLKGDWSGRSVIEQNTCYRMQWGSAQRCVGWKSRADEETVDGHVKCEKWIRDDDNGSEQSKTSWWLKRLIGKTKTVTLDWPFPFAENKLFVLTLIAGLEGYHINVDNRHISSFPYRPGFTLEDATGLYMTGDVDIHSIFAASLPVSHPSTSSLKHLELSPQWKAPSLPTEPIELFIGVLSAAMHARKEVNVELMKEADYFGDIVIVPYMDNYDLVVLKTIAICEYGVRTVAAKYIMKCDDDTFVKIDAVMMEVNKIRNDRSFYIGNINYYHKPLRHGKWAVTYEEWLEEDYPPYANGPGYIVSSDIAQYIVSEFEKHKLRLFKMEDVSMGMWVEQFNNSSLVEYVHSFKFCQFGCIEGYITAHYQSPRQMTCLWEKMQLHGKPQCCNTR